MNIDTYILLWINGHHAEWLDQIMWWVSQSITWIPLYILMVTWVVWKHRCDWKKILLILLAFVVAVGLSDFITSGIIKPAVQRLRPTHTPGLASLLHIVNGYTGGKYGFCSSHAANTMSCALLFAFLCKNKIATTALMLVVTVLAAFAFARLNFRGKDLAFTLFLSLMMIPSELVVITNFVTITNMDLRNTFLGLILPSVTSVFYMTSSMPVMV